MCVSIKSILNELQLRSDEKRVTVMFRGSVNEADWKTNLNASLEKLDSNEVLDRLGWEGKLEVHRGFKGMSQLP